MLAIIEVLLACNICKFKANSVMIWQTSVKPHIITTLSFHLRSTFLNDFQVDNIVLL